MRIAITGSHRVGKTTLIEKLQESLPDYVCLGEVYYELEESGYFFSGNMVVEDYITMLDYSIEQITASEENVIFDRSPIDFLAYIRSTTNNNRMDNLDFESLYHKVKDAMNEIDLLVFVPIESPDLIVCPESELPELRRSVNDILRDYLNDFKSEINLMEVAGSALDRRDQVIRMINRLN